jgi:hypothetical protein
MEIERAESLIALEDGGKGAGKGGLSLFEELQQGRDRVQNFERVAGSPSGTMDEQAFLFSKLLKMDHVGDDPSFQRAAMITNPCRNAAIAWVIMEVMLAKKVPFTVANFKTWHARVRERVQ